MRTPSDLAAYAAILAAAVAVGVIVGGGTDDDASITFFCLAAGALLAFALSAWLGRGEDRG